MQLDTMGPAGVPHNSLHESDISFSIWMTCRFLHNLWFIPDSTARVTSFVLVFSGRHQVQVTVTTEYSFPSGTTEASTKAPPAQLHSNYRVRRVITQRHTRTLSSIWAEQTESKLISNGLFELQHLNFHSSLLLFGD